MNLSLWDCLRIGLGIALSFGMFFGMLYLGSLVGRPVEYRPPARAVTTVRPPSANLPQPRAEGEEAWVPVSHADVLQFLSPSMRAEFEPRPDITHSSKSRHQAALLPTSFQELVDYYQKAVLQGTASTNDYREIERAMKLALRTGRS